MLKIKETKQNSLADYELENGILLFEKDWNTEIYRNGYDTINNCDSNKEYKPVYRFEIENIDLNKIEENSEKWYYATEIISFEEL
jgi:hypothetical protein